MSRKLPDDDNGNPIQVLSYEGLPPSGNGKEAVGAASANYALTAGSVFAIITPSS